MRKILAILAISTILSACGGQSVVETTSPVPTMSPTASTTFLFETDPEVLGPDLQAYLNELGNIGALENEVVGLFDAVSGDNFTTNEQLQKQLELIIPKANEFLSKLQKIKTKQPEVEHFHAQYVAIWTQQTRAFEAMDAAIAAKDDSALQNAASEIEIARSKIAPLQRELQALTEYAGIEIVF